MDGGEVTSYDGGDANGDTKFDNKDMILLQKYLLNPTAVKLGPQA